MAQLLHMNPRDWPMPGAEYGKRRPTLEEIMRTGAAWPSLSPPPDPRENEPPVFSHARKPRTPLSPYAPPRRPAATLGDRGFERALRDVQRSPIPPLVSESPRTRKARSGSARRHLPAKPFELRDEGGRASLSPRLNRWLTHQMTGSSNDYGAGVTAARHADIEAQKLRQQQKHKAAEREMKRCLVPLLRLIEETNTTAIKGDATAALLSLSLNPANANAFVLTGAFRVLFDLCSETDPHIRANVLGMLYALAESLLTRRLLVQQGCVRAVVPHTRLKNPEVAKLVTGTLLHLCALEQNRDEMLTDTVLVPALLALLAPAKHSSATPRAPRSSRSGSKGRVSGTDPRLQYDAISVLSLLVHNDTKRKLHLLDGGTPSALLRLAGDDTRLNDLRLHAMNSLEALLGVDGADFPRQALDTFSSTFTQETISVLLLEDDMNLLASVLRLIRLLSSKVPSFNRHFVNSPYGCLNLLLNHAQRLSEFLQAKSDGKLTHREIRAISPTGRASPVGSNCGRGSGPGSAAVKNDTSPSAVLSATVAALLTVVRSKNSLEQIFKLQHCPTVMELCRASHKRVRRGGGNLLQQLSTLNNSKLWLHASGATPLLLKLLAERPDEFVIHTAATTLAELAEEPSVRVEMGQEPGLLQTLVDLVFQLGIPAVRFEVSRTLADLAEAVDNRLVITLRCAKALVSLLRTKEDDDPRTLTHAVRCFSNLSACAGHTSDCSPPFTSRYGALQHKEYGLGEESDDDDDDSGEDGVEEEEEDAEEEGGQATNSEDTDVTCSDEVAGEPGSDVRGLDAASSDEAVALDGKGSQQTTESAMRLSEEESDEEDVAQDVDYYWDTDSGLAMARNFNMYLLPQIHEQIASSGALGLILSAAARQQTNNIKAQNRRPLSSLISTGAVERDADDGLGKEDPVVRTYVTHILRQLMLDVKKLAAQTTQDTTAGAQNHHSTCLVCKGLSNVLRLPSDSNRAVPSGTILQLPSETTIDNSCFFDFDQARQLLLTRGLKKTRDILSNGNAGSLARVSREAALLRCPKCVSRGARLELLQCPDCTILQQQQKLQQMHESELLNQRLAAYA